MTPSAPAPGRSAVASAGPSAPGTYAVTDPATERVIAHVPDGGADAAAEAVAHAVEAARTWSVTSLDVRRRVLGIAAERLAAREAELVELAIADTGARVKIARDTQVRAAIARLRSWAEASGELLELEPPPDLGGLRSRVRRIPAGVVACISPYNFPLLAMVGKVAPALFAGNTVVMKPAPQDPLLVVALADALAAGLAEAGAHPGVAGLVTGAGPEPGAALVRHPDVGAVSFTGSTTVGIEIYRDAAPAMKRLLIEAGGKGACVVCEDADLEPLADALTRTWTVQSGQVCLTPTRIVAHRRVHDRLAELLATRLRGLRVGDPRDPDTDVGPLISAEQRGRVEALVRTVEDEGGDLVRDAASPARGHYSAPALAVGSPPGSTLMQREAFGPVLATTAVDDDAEAVAVANGTPYGLYDYVFSADPDRARAIAARLTSGSVGVNTLRRNTGAPFGGNKLSGVGHSGGRYALATCTDLRTETEEIPEGGR